jgi:hypothetical protein
VETPVDEQNTSLSGEFPITEGLLLEIGVSEKEVKTILCSNLITAGRDTWLTLRDLKTKDRLSQACGDPVIGERFESYFKEYDAQVEAVSTSGVCKENGKEGKTNRLLSSTNRSSTSATLET